MSIFVVMKLNKQNDPMGLAIRDFFETGSNQPLRILSSMFEEDEMPVPNLFRNEMNMPDIERQALKLCKGRTLDVGAGAGCHSLVLQQNNIDVTAIDISPNSVEIMRERGIKQAYYADFFTDDFGTEFDTILMLMNGMGIAGSLNRLPQLLERCAELMRTDGCILADSSDLRYVFEDENGNLDWNAADGYYGEIDFQIIYGSCKGPTFNWLYVDFTSLQLAAKQAGLVAELIKKGKHYDYLARLRK